MMGMLRQNSWPLTPMALTKGQSCLPLLAVKGQWYLLAGGG